VKYGEGGTQQSKQAQLFAQSIATCHIRTTEGTAGTDQELKTSSTRIGKTSLETLTHLSYRSMRKQYYTKDTRSSTGGSTNISIHHRPSPGDPREHMHRVLLQGLRMVGNKLTTKDEEAYRNKGTHKPRSPHRHNSPRHRSSSQRSRSASPKYDKSPRRGGTRRSRTPTRACDYDDDKKEMGALCFTRRVRTTLVPKGFKLPHDQQKYD
jgi:hypothetical protein